MSESTKKPKVSNPAGRPKGSKNKITYLKLMAEEAVRSGESARIQEVCRNIVMAALEGDRDCRKMVWSAVMSKAGNEAQSNSGEMPQIVIRMDSAPKSAEVSAPEPIPTPIEEITKHG